MRFRPTLLNFELSQVVQLVLRTTGQFFPVSIPLTTGSNKNHVGLER